MSIDAPRPPQRVAAPPQILTSPPKARPRSAGLSNEGAGHHRRAGRRRPHLARFRLALYRRRRPAGAGRPPRRAGRRRRQARPQAQGAADRQRVHSTTPGSCCCCRRPSRSSSATRSGSRCSPTPAIASSIRCASIRLCAPTSRRARSSSSSSRSSVRRELGQVSLAQLADAGAHRDLRCDPRRSRRQGARRSA